VCCVQSDGILIAFLRTAWSRKPEWVWSRFQCYVDISYPEKILLLSWQNTTWESKSITIHITNRLRPTLYKTLDWVILINTGPLIWDVWEINIIFLEKIKYCCIAQTNRSLVKAGPFSYEKNPPFPLYYRWRRKKQTHCKQTECSTY